MFGEGEQDGLTRLGQWKHLLSAMTELQSTSQTAPMLICGDLNTRSTGTLLQKFLDESWASAIPLQSETGQAFSSLVGTERRLVDYIIYSKGSLASLAMLQMHEVRDGKVFVGAEANSEEEFQYSDHCVIGAEICFMNS